MPHPAFEPIAIVGQSCVLPGALSPEAFWNGIVRGADFLGDVPAGRWRLAEPCVLGAGADRARCKRGGFVSGFEQVFAADSYGVPAQDLLILDPLVQWSLHAAREALRDAGLIQQAQTLRAGLVLGNLSYPSASLSRLVETQHHDRQAHAVLDADARSRAGVGEVAAINRFMSGWPALHVAQLLGLSEGGFALDAACASSLYAIKHACDRLHDRRADLMLAGGVNAVDSLFLQMGFSALEALSPSGRSRPFHRNADGLLPAEGAAFVVLRRLADAVAANEPILGVIRGVGLSNDGRGRALLAPSEEGQLRAMRLAYQTAGLEPDDVSLIECHATGTKLGDGVELASMSRIFGHTPGLVIGSVKSNIGHLITVAGMAGLLKLLAAMRHNVLPPMREIDVPLPQLYASPFRLLDAPREWVAHGAKPRLAGLNAFGFGGNNAHLVLEQWRGHIPQSKRIAHPPSSPPRQTPEPGNEDIVVVGIGACVASGNGKEDFARQLFTGESALREGADGRAEGRCVEIAMPPERPRFPPHDLLRALPQQLLVLKAAMQAVQDAGQLDSASTGVLIGMQCDTDVARCGMRWRLAEWAALRAYADQACVDATWLDTARDAVEPPLNAAGALGKMPNIPANRIGSHFDFQGWSHTVAAEQASGVVALDLAIRALCAHELDTALVGAVDLCCEPVHRHAADAVLAAHERTPGDAAVVLVLKRLSDTRRDGDRIYGQVAVHAASAPSHASHAVRWCEGENGFGLTAQFGHAHAASGLLQVAAALLACRHAALPQASRLALPWATPAQKPRRIELELSALGGLRQRVTISSRDHAGARGVLTETACTFHLYAAADRAGVWHALSEGREGGDGPCRLAIVAASDEQRRLRQAIALAQLGSDTPPTALRWGEGVYYREAPIGGEIGFVYSMAGASYAGMGQRLLLALPELSERLGGCFRDPGAIVASLSPPGGDSPIANGAHTDMLAQLRAYSLLCHAHTSLSTAVLGLRPAAAFGLCTGESSALFCLGAWSEPDTLFDAVEASGLYTRELAGNFAAVGRAWNVADPDWVAWRVLAPLVEVRAAMADEPHVHLAIVHTDGDSLVVGDRRGCERVITTLGVNRARAIAPAMAIHCPEVEPFAEQWRAIHHRPTRPLPGLRLYSQAVAAAFPLDRETVADALTSQALNTVHFPRLIETAWRDGVRVFVEHGPRGLCSSWIKQILGNREHVAIALDSAHRSGIVQLAYATAQLWAAGVTVPYEAIAQRLRDAAATTRQHANDARPSLRARAHAPDVVLPPWPVTKPASTDPRLAATQTFNEGTAMTGLINPLENVKPSAAKTPLFTREQLETLACGSIASVFGPLFARQEHYRCQVRMPMPPLLLADRVMHLDAKPGVLATGSIRTETDVRADAWHMHRGRMPAGIMIEAGQADLLLISWMGIDFLNRGERIYRLLGCRLTYHAPLPRAGETLEYTITIDGHAEHDGVRLFFFHFDCQVDGQLRLSVQGGQAGFFTQEELANSGGILWDAASAKYAQGARVDPPAVACRYASFDEAQVRAFAEGRLYDCFGHGYELAQTHVDPPRIANGRMQLLDRVTHLATAGGPFKRGHLRAELSIEPDQWFFDGHFLNDPCMPGTLMFEGCLQAMAFYLSALGYSLDKDGWVFEPVPGQTFDLRCRGQVIPGSKLLVYELFVEEVHNGPEPTLYADLLCVIDGLKSFHCRRMAYRLRPSWPVHNRPCLQRPVADDHPVAVVDDFRFDYASLLATAWGKPSEAFGKRYELFDSYHRTCRLPGPPYHFMSRVVQVKGMQRPVAGASVVVEYDIDPDAWYFAQSGQHSMPFCILLEAALQPCGWLSAYVGCPLASVEDFKFRNLDGTGTVHGEILPSAKVLRTRAELTHVSRSGDTYILSFDVACDVDGKSVYTMKTVFGYFPSGAFDNQRGLPPPSAKKALPAREPNNRLIDLDRHPARNAAAGVNLPHGMLLAIDRVVGYWPQGGNAGLGRLWAEKDVNPSLWFFKAHFYQDPVQPGSLGLEAMLQLLQFYMQHEKLDDGIVAPRFESPALERGMTWKYRGQVVPSNRLIRIEMEITERGRHTHGAFARANAWLWVDGLRIYEAIDIGTRIVAGDGMPEPAGDIKKNDADRHEAGSTARTTVA